MFGWPDSSGIRDGFAAIFASAVEALCGGDAVGAVSDDVTGEEPKPQPYCTD